MIARFLLAHRVLLRAVHRPLHRGQGCVVCRVVCRIVLAELRHDPEFMADIEAGG